MVKSILTIHSAAYVLSAIAGKDPYDNYTSAIPFDTTPDYVGALNFSSLGGKRIGVPRNVIYDEQGDGPVLASFTQAIKVIQAAGATVIDNLLITPDAENEYLNGNASTIVLDADFVSDLPNLYLSQLVSNPNDVTDLESVRAFTQSFGPEDYPDRDTGVWDQSLSLGFGNTSPEFWAAYQRNLQIAGPEGILGLMQNYSLDALILPTDFSPDLPARLGTPVVTVPMGFYPDNTTVVFNRRRTLVELGPSIPYVIDILIMNDWTGLTEHRYGLSFIGRAFSEADLIGYAYAYEQRTLTRDTKLPYIAPNTELSDVVGMNSSMQFKRHFHALM